MVTMADLRELAIEARQRRTVPLHVGWDRCKDRARRHGRAAVLYSAVLSVDELLDAGIDELPPDVRAALERAAPGFDIRELEHYPQESIDGLVQTVKGALFEQEVAAGLVDGELGDVRLPSGAIPVLGDFTTPGSDLVIQRDGDVLTQVQLKASASADDIAEHLRRFPEVDTVYATHEAALDAAVRGLQVEDTHLADADLVDRVASAFHDQASTSIGEVLDEVVPQLTLVLVLVEWAVLRRNGFDPAEASARARRRVADALIVSSAGGIASALSGTDGLRLPIVLSLRLLLAKERSVRSLVPRLEAVGHLLTTIKQHPTTRTEYGHHG